jgi:hypothetical protein
VDFANEFAHRSAHTDCTIASFVNYRIPDATIDGFVGRLDDTPYMETSNAVEWNTQEVWGVPFYHAIGAVTYLSLIESAH